MASFINMSSVNFDPEKFRLLNKGNAPDSKAPEKKNRRNVSIILLLFLAISFGLNIYLGLAPADCDRAEVLDQLNQCSESLALGQEQLDDCVRDLRTANYQVVECLLNCSIELETQNV